jgi:hypothetical protein
MPSTATIVQRAFAYVPDNIMQLVGEYTRQFKVTNAWQRIRIGVLCAVTPDGTSNITDCPFILGVCSSGLSFSASRSNFVGASLIGVAQGGAKLLTHNASTTAPYYNATAGQSFRKVEQTVTQIAATTATFLVPAFTGWFKRRSAYYVDITKSLGGGGAATVTIYGPPQAGVMATDLRPDHFLQGLDSQGTPTINGQLFVALATTATNLGEELGPLDTFNLVWTRSAFPLEVSALGAAIIYPNETYSDGKAGGSDDTFESYAVSGTATPIPTGSLNLGSGWGGAIYLAGSYSNPQYQTGYSGTSLGFPDDAFEQYITNGPVYNGTVISGGTGWGGVAIMGGSYSNLGPQAGYAGTSSGFPDDTFESYSIGTITSGVTVNAGNGWQGVAYVYP